MQHTLTTEGFGARLRPVRLDDAQFIVWLRNLAHAKGRIGDSAVNTASQEAWMEQYFRRPGDYYFIIETSGGIPVGAYGIYGIVDSSGESGRWIIRPDVPAAIPSAMLAFDLAFGFLKLTEIRVTTVSTNLPVLSLNKKFGFRQIGVEKDSQIIGGQSVDLVRFVMTPPDWAKPRERLLPLARLAEQQIRDWEILHQPKPGSLASQAV